MSTFPQELARAWRRYFTTQDAPRLSPEVASVVIVEDLTKGPYLPSRAFQIGGSNFPVAGNYSITTIRNTGGRGSVVCIDKLRIRGSGELVIGVRTESYGLANNFGSKLALDRAPEALAKSYNSGELFVGDVKMSFDKGVSVVGYDTIPVLLNGPGAGEFYAELDGPWIIGQAGEMSLQTGSLNSRLDVFAVGRYYTLS